MFCVLEQLKVIFTIENEDYIHRTHNITFPAGMTSISFDVSIIDDNILEGNENFTLSIDLSSLPYGFIITNSTQATITIVDNDCKYYSLLLIHTYINLKLTVCLQLYIIYLLLSGFINVAYSYNIRFKRLYVYEQLTNYIAIASS